MTNHIVTVGIDVSSKKLDLYGARSQKFAVFSNDADGIRQIVEFVREENAEIVAFEATGGYENPLANALRENGVPFARLDPARVRNYAKAMGKRAKTDAIDAKTIAEFAAATRPKADEGGKNARLQALTRRREQLIGQKTAEEKRRKQCGFSDISAGIESHIHYLGEEIKKVENLIKTEIKASEELTRKHEIVTSVKGCGNVLASFLLAGMPELGKASNGEIAALTGLAPFNRDSGKFKGKRFIGGGRPEVRRALYMPTLVATRHNPDIKAFYEKLIKAGKPAKVALTACMRKLVILINALFKDNRKWSEKKYAQP